MNFPQDDTDKIDLTLASASAKAEEGKTLTHSFTFDRVRQHDGLGFSPAHRGRRLLAGNRAALLVWEVFATLVAKSNAWIPPS